MDLSVMSGAGWTGVSNDYVWPANRPRAGGAAGSPALLECHSTPDHWSMSSAFIDVGREKPGAAECAPSRRNTTRQARYQDCRTTPSAPPQYCTDQWRYRVFCLLPTLRSESLRESNARH